MTEIDWAVIKDAFAAPEITIDVYKRMPEEVSKLIEVVDGLLVRWESAEPTHQLIAHNFVNVLHEAMTALAREQGSCPRCRCPDGRGAQIPFPPSRCDRLPAH
jgi:hypothetical protein